MHTGALVVLDRLAIQALISPLEGTGTPVFALAEHLGGERPLSPFARLPRPKLFQPRVLHKLMHVL